MDEAPKTNFVAETPKRRVAKKGYTKVAYRIDYGSATDALASAMAGKRFFTVRDIRRFNKFGDSAARRLATQAVERGVIKPAEKQGAEFRWTVTEQVAKPKQPRVGKAGDKLAFLDSLKAVGMDAKLLEAIRRDVELADSIRKLIRFD